MFRCSDRAAVGPVHGARAVRVDAGCPARGAAAPPVRGRACHPVPQRRHLQGRRRRRLGMYRVVVGNSFICSHCV